MGPWPNRPIGHRPMGQPGERPDPTLVCRGGGSDPALPVRARGRGRDDGRLDQLLCASRRLSGWPARDAVDARGAPPQTAWRERDVRNRCRLPACTACGGISLWLHAPQIEPMGFAKRRGQPHGAGHPILPSMPAAKPNSARAHTTCNMCIRLYPCPCPCPCPCPV